MAQNILIDYSPLKAGGGCQLALNFIWELDKMETLKSEEYIFLIPDVGPLKDLQDRFPKFKFIVSPSSSVIKRLCFEYFTLEKLLHKYSINTVFTFFGAGLPKYKSVKSIVSVAYPIICYEDSAYWKYVPAKQKLKQLLINRFRIARLKKADLILVETEIMKQRLAKVLDRDQTSLFVISPAPSGFIPFEERVYEKKDTLSFLFLSGVARHKNIWRLPELAEALSAYIPSFKFSISTSLESFKGSLTQEQLALYEKYKRYFVFLGSIKPDEIGRAYAEADFLVSLSDLESFSNNYMEAWKTGLPLIVSDRDFARHICRKSALYIEPHEVKRAAADIFKYISDDKLINECMKEGKVLLAELPDANLKTAILLDLLSKNR